MLKTASVEAIQVAAEWLKETMKQLVGIVCEGSHAAEGEPPQMESGVGRNSIRMNRLSNGAEVGVPDIGTQNMIAGNYMAGWDSEEGIRGFHHPWLSLWKRYEAEMAKIIHREMQLKTGAT